MTNKGLTSGYIADYIGTALSVLFDDKFHNGKTRLKEVRISKARKIHTCHDCTFQENIKKGMKHAVLTFTTYRGKHFSLRFCLGCYQKRIKTVLDCLETLLKKIFVMEYGSDDIQWRPAFLFDEDSMAS